jgi:hypothetical protein
MRVISQNGKYDLPYEETTLQIFNSGKVAAYSLVDLLSNDYIEIATYSTVEKAKKAVEMCREKYLTRMELDGGYDMTNGCYVQPNYWVLPKVFQFPADEDIEV